MKYMGKRFGVFISSAVVACLFSSSVFALPLHSKHHILGATDFSKTNNFRYSNVLREDAYNPAMSFEENIHAIAGGADVDLLKQQNESLRDTIRAQNDVIKQMQQCDGQGLSALSAENEMLRQQIKQAAELSSMNGKAASRFKDQNKQLEDELQKLKQQGLGVNLAGLQETIRQLKAENNRLLNALANASVTEASAGDEPDAFVSEIGSSVVADHKAVHVGHDHLESRPMQVFTSEDGVAALLQAEAVTSPDVSMVRGESVPISGKSFDEIDAKTVHVKTDKPSPELIKPLLGSDQFALDSKTR